MAKRKAAEPQVEETSLAIPQEGALMVPDWMADEAGVGLENTQRLIIPPRVRIVQAQSRAPLRDLFNIGDTVAVPQNLLIAEHPYNGARAAENGQAFHVIPLFFYVEFLVWNDIKLQATEPSVLQRSVDPDSEIALKARNPNTWREPHPSGKDNHFIRYSEHLNFIISINEPEHEAYGLPMVMSFSGAEHRTGANWLALLKMRRAPIYGCGFQISTSNRENSKGNWYGWDITNPMDRSKSWVSKELLEQYREVYTEMKEAYDQGTLQADYEDDEAATTATPNDAGEF